MIFSGDPDSISKKPYMFVIFWGRGGKPPVPHPPLDPRMYYLKLFGVLITGSHDGLLKLKDNDDLYQSVWTGIDIRCMLVMEDNFILRFGSIVFCIYKCTRLE